MCVPSLLLLFIHTWFRHWHMNKSRCMFVDPFPSLRSPCTSYLGYGMDITEPYCNPLTIGFLCCFISPNSVWFNCALSLYFLFSLWCEHYWTLLQSVVFLCWPLPKLVECNNLQNWVPVLSIWSTCHWGIYVVVPEMSATQHRIQLYKIVYLSTYIWLYMA